MTIELKPGDGSVLQEFNISDIRIHPNFNNATLVNDIALLKLERPAKRQQNIDVVCVASAASLEVARVSRCYVTGWGRRSETSEHSVVLKVILLSDWSLYHNTDLSLVQEIAVPLWEQERCGAALQQQFGDTYTLPATALCAGAEGRDACDVSSC